MLVGDETNRVAVGREMRRGFNVCILTPEVRALGFPLLYRGDSIFLGLVRFTMPFLRGARKSHIALSPRGSEIHAWLRCFFSSVQVSSLHVNTECAEPDLVERPPQKKERKKGKGKK